ncbi:MULTISPECIES: SEC-C domain-containing protein [Streptomyces]|uniref:SEC-C domain-containing protein n=1 Tax=Streptomyces TaxID=1883 RepID=UPI00053DE438|nr:MULTISPECIES: SEC-C domain-containing protein [unclassified Streptomyces]QOZ99403.1 hypothetical protein DI273_09935 [Streptomyces violascens]
MRPDTPAEPTPHASHTAEAERLERAAALYPEDAEQLLLQAAAHHEVAGSRDRATALYDRLLALPAEQPVLVRALKAANLWEYGHEAEARAIVDGVRLAAPRSPEPWIIVAEALEAHDELESAHSVFTDATELLVGDSANPPREVRPLLFGRHRVRRLLGADHDARDELADRLHEAPVPLDELHDPNRVWSLGSDNPAELRAEIDRLRAELGTYRAALSRPFPVAVLHWPEDELAQLLAAHPALTTEYPSHESHLTAVESALRELATTGTPHLGTVSATLPSYEAFAASEAASPTDPSLLPLYATTLAARGRAKAWPPAEEGACWCGAGREYGVCHGAA